MNNIILFVEDDQDDEPSFSTQEEDVIRGGNVGCDSYVHKTSRIQNFHRSGSQPRALLVAPQSAATGNRVNDDG
jgi:hypothetical protein